MLEFTAQYFMCNFSENLQEIAPKPSAGHLGVVGIQIESSSAQEYSDLAERVKRVRIFQVCCSLISIL